MENIQMIRIERLHPHPDNPRKERQKEDED